MKKLFTLVTFFCMTMGFAWAQVPSQAEDVMLQAFYWNSHSQTKWTSLKSQADEIGSYFTLVWLPPAAAAEGGGSSNMGYHPYNYGNLSSSWGNGEDLKALISALKAKGCRTIADIVINHHAGNNACCDYPQEKFGSYGTFQLNKSHICSNDEQHGNGANDAGYGEWQCGASGGYCAARDLDHSSSYVQNYIKAYLKWMKNEIGYDGWRYDLVKGYLGKYTKDYNATAGAYMSVGEYYDGSYDGCWNWVKETNFTSMVFDFPFHDAMVKWGGGSDYSKLVWKDGNTDRPAGVCHSSSSRKYAVTFIDNHDTDTSHTDGNWPYGGDWLKANAIMLASPGIPCVFWKHWANSVCREQIKKMIAARKAAGVHSESDVVVNHYNGYYESTATGKKGKLKCFVGSGWSAPSGYTKACSGEGWAYYTTAEGGQQGGGSQGGGEQGGGEQGGGSVSGSSFYIRINGSTDYAASPVGEQDMQGRDQYMASVYVKAGQTVSMYDKDNNAEWTICNLDPYGSYQNFSMSGSGASCKMTCNVAGCYDFYIKLKFEDDMIYVGPGTNCTSQGEQGGGTQGGGTQGGGSTPTTGFSILVNGTNYAASPVGEQDMQGRDQYMASAYVKAGQTVSCYDNENKAEWTICNLDPYGSYQNFTMSGTGASCKMTCNVDGCYDFYIKLKFEDDMIYVGPGTNCSSQGEQGGEQGGSQQGGGTQGGGTQGGGSSSSNHVWYVKGYINGVDVNGMEGDNEFDGGIVNYSFTGTKNYVFVIYQEHGVAGVQYMATAGNVVEGVTHTTLSPTGTGKFVIPAGVSKVYLYDNGNGTIEISTQIIPGKTLIDGIVTAADEAEASVTTIYPNPVDDVLNIESQTEFDSAVVTSLAGQTMFFAIDNNTVAVGSLAKGLYIINLVSEDGTVEQAKFIKK